MRDRLLPAEPALWADSRRNSPALAELRDEAKAQSLFALPHPPAMGGQGVPFGQLAQLADVIGWSDWGQYALGTVSYQDCTAIGAMDPSPLVRAWLEALATGRTWPSLAMSEPGAAGSDPSLIETAATRTGNDGWRVTGEKWFVTDAAVATHVLAFVKTGDGLTAFLVPTDAKGFDVLREIPVMGEDPSGVYHVRLDGIELSDDHVVGGVGNGARVAQARLVPGRILHCSRWIGQAQRAFALMCERANDRKAHGGVLADKGQIQDLVAHTAADIYSARLMVHDVAARYERGDDVRTEVSLLKVVAATAVTNAVDRAVQVWGAAGVAADLPLERMLRRSRFTRIIDGPDELHRSVAARRILSRYPGAVPWSETASLMGAAAGSLDG